MNTHKYHKLGYIKTNQNHLIYNKSGQNINVDLTYSIGLKRIFLLNITVTCYKN